MDWTELQEQLDRWREHNFPSSSPDEDFEGMVEELGELAKARLKGKQGIRPEVSGPEIEKDCIADLTIYAMQYCSKNGWDFETIVTETALKVMKRDWVTDPTAGGEVVNTSLRNSPDQDPDYKRLPN